MQVFLLTILCFVVSKGNILLFKFSGLLHKLDLKQMIVVASEKLVSMYFGYIET